MYTCNVCFAACSLNLLVSVASSIVAFRICREVVNLFLKDFSSVLITLNMSDHSRHYIMLNTALQKRMFHLLEKE
jgi:hypothetical protein